MGKRKATDGGRLLELSSDYSEDELDAIAELYDRARLRMRRSPADRDERTRRAVADAALRALVARRAMVLEGGPSRPRVRLLEPHASVLEPFVHPEAIVAIRAFRPDSSTVLRVLFVREDAVVVQEALPGHAICRMTLHPRKRVLDHLLAGVPDPSEDAVQDRAPLELTVRMLERTERAIANGAPTPDGVPDVAVDVLYARVISLAFEITRLDEDGAIVVERRAWMAAGNLGAWELVDGDGDPPATVTLTPRGGDDLREWLTDVATTLAP